MATKPRLRNTKPSLQRVKMSNLVSAILALPAGCAPVQRLFICSPWTGMMHVTIADL